MVPPIATADENGRLISDEWRCDAHNNPLRNEIANSTEVRSGDTLRDSILETIEINNYVHGRLISKQIT